MTHAEVTVEFHLLLWMIAVVLATAATLGAITSGGRRSVLAIVLASAFTAVGMLATVRPNEADGQTGLGIPLMWIPFFLVSWLGSVLGAKLGSRRLTEPKR